MNFKKLALSFIAVFPAIFATDFVIHGVIMKSTYQATPHLWRPEADMPAFMGCMLLGQATLALFFSWIFLHGYKGKGLGEGIRYGLLMAGFLAGNNLVMYAVSPYDFGMVAAWIGFAAVQGVVGGVICALVSGKTQA